MESPDYTATSAVLTLKSTDDLNRRQDNFQALSRIEQLSKRKRFMRGAFLSLALLPAFLTTITEAKEHNLGSTTKAIQGGGVVPIGRHEAVGSLGNCTASLIGDTLVLTAAHCFCPTTQYPDGCARRATFTLFDVKRKDDPNTANIDESLTRGNVRISGDVRVFERFEEPKTPGGPLLWLGNDFALVELDTRVSTAATLKPIEVELPRNQPEIGDNLTLVGFGRSGSGCTDPFGTKREITLPLWGIYEPNPTMQIGTREMGSCPGDSGGPALNENGKIVGVSSTAPGNYDSTHVAANFLAGFRDLGGTIVGSPTAVHTGNGRVEVFVRGAHNNDLVQRSWNGRSWSGWKNLGGDLADSPVAVHTGDGRIEVFVRGAHNDELVQRSWNGRSWSGWKNLGGDIKSNPTAVHTGNGRIEVFVRGAHNDELVQRSWNGRGWSGWKNLGGDLADSPVAVHTGDGRIEVFVRGAHNDELVQRSWNGRRWSGWRNLGGDIKSSPTAVHVGNGRIAVFVRGAHNNELVKRSWNGRNWSGWKNLGGDLADAPSALRLENGEIHIFSVGRFKELLQLKR